MKNRCTSISRRNLLALLLSALLLLGMLPTIGIADGQNETKGSLTVKLNAESQNRLSGGSSVPEVTLYQIGVADQDSKSGWTMHTEFAGFGVIEAKDSEELADVASQIVEALKSNTTIQGQKKPMTNGQAVFDNLDLGIYLGVVTGVPSYVVVTPFIVTVPSRNPKEPHDLRFNYDVTVKDEWITSLTVKKVWKDGNDQDKIRPEDIVVQVKNGSMNVGDPITLSEKNSWQATVPNLAMYANNNLITYTVDEVSVPKDYTKTVSKDLDDTPAFSYEIENAHTPEETAVKVTKKWDDANNQDGVRPASIQVQLKNGSANVGASVTLNADNDWSYTWTKLARNAAGVPITYTLDEVSVSDSYTKTVTKTADGVDLVEYEIENKHTPEEISVKVTKKWSDANDQDAIRPDSVVVQLKNGTENVGESVTLNAGNSWSHTWTKLPKYAGGVAIDYTVDEVKVPTGYKKTVTKLEGSADLIEYEIDNAHTPTETEATIIKVWEDSNNKDNLRPKSISVSLLKGGEVVKAVELSDANGWKETVPNLPKYDKGKEIKYTWSEAKVDGYTSTQVTNGTITQLTNVHTTTTTTPTTTTTTPPNPPPTPTDTPKPTTSVPVRKVWDDANNAHNKRPSSITLILLADGVQVDQKTIAGSATSEAWSYTFTNLPELNDDGSTIKYTVDEIRVEGYEPPVVDGTTITNKLTEQPPREYKHLTGKKTWIEVNATNGGAEPQRPSYITVYLLRDGEVIETRTVTAASGWTYDFGDQPVDDGYGHVYKYTVREDGVPGYFCKTDGLNLINTWITNDRPPEGDTPDTPKGNTPPNRDTPSDMPPIEDLTEEEFNELFDVLGYDTPLWGQLLGTGDETPIYPYVFGGVGLIAIIGLLVIGRKRRNRVK